MVARLKLKGIDGRAPPGVNRLQLAAVALLRTAARKGEVVQARCPRGSNLNASPLESGRHPQIDGELLKLQIPSLAFERNDGGQVNSLG